MFIKIILLNHMFVFMPRLKGGVFCMLIQLHFRFTWKERNYCAVPIHI